ncbi:hypothetical protein [Paenibacillus aquistagni]|uniref:hypothetical protein n=1 Tax=Paenibacillus aquistagni TaxID=1852522 RepID=UPI00145C0881|nr:hypothetical protein [Paenibacillus aquistagni]
MYAKLFERNISRYNREIKSACNYLFERTSDFQLVKNIYRNANKFPVEIRKEVINTFVLGSLLPNVNSRANYISILSDWLLKNNSKYKNSEYSKQLKEFKLALIIMGVWVLPLIESYFYYLVNLYKVHVSPIDWSYSYPEKFDNEVLNIIRKIRTVKREILDDSNMSLAQVSNDITINDSILVNDDLILKYIAEDKLEKIEMNFLKKMFI